MSIVDSLISAWGANQANNINIDQAQQNRQFQTDMSNTAYQRATKDMEAAGLNPMLAYTQGGASQPSGNVASAQNIAQGFDSGIGEVMGMMSTAAQIENVKAQTHKTNVEADKASREGRIRQFYVDYGGLNADQKGWIAKAEQFGVDYYKLKTLQGMGSSGVEGPTADGFTNRVIQEQKAELQTILANAARASSEQALSGLKALFEKSSFDTRFSMLRTDKNMQDVAQLIQKLSLPEFKAMAKYFESEFGKALPFQKQIESGANTAANIASTVLPWARFNRGTTTWSERSDSSGNHSWSSGGSR